MWVVLALLGTCDTCCKDGSTCSTAFHNQPGVCCGVHNGAWHCCPYGARCVACPSLEEEYHCAWPGEQVACHVHEVRSLNFLSLFLIGVLTSILLLSCWQRCCSPAHSNEIVTVHGTSVNPTSHTVPITRATLVHEPLYYGGRSDNIALALGTGLLGGILVSDGLEEGCPHVQESVDTGFPDE